MGDGTWFFALSRLSSLQQIRLEMCHPSKVATNSVLSQICRLGQLTQLHLSDDAAVADIWLLPTQLQHLQLDYCGHGAPISGIMLNLQHLIALQQLILDCQHLAD